jgi:hypothetical protein
VHHLAHFLHHHFQLLIELNLQVLGRNHLCLSAIFEEEHPPELTPELFPLSSQYPQLFGLQ